MGVVIGTVSNAKMDNSVPSASSSTSGRIAVNERKLYAKSVAKVCGGGRETWIGNPDGTPCANGGICIKGACIDYCGLLGSNPVLSVYYILRNYDI